MDQTAAAGPADNPPKAKPTVPSFRLPRPFASFSGYRAGWLPGDAAAAVTLAAIAVPEQIATARLIHMPPAAGLLAFAAGSLAFAVFGAHRQLSVGADSTIAPVAAAALAAVATAGTLEYGAAAATLALMVGGLLVLTGVFRLGWIAQLLSIPVTTGFLLGIAVHIVVGELPALLGIAAPEGTLPARLVAIAAHLGDAGMAPMAIGFGTLALCLVAERIDQRVPGPMLALVLAGLVAWKLGLAARGLAMLDPLPPVMPAPDLHVSAWRDAAGLLTVALMVSLLCMMQTSSVLQAFPPPEGEREDAGREFAAVGAGSILAGLVGAFPVDASPPRTAIVTAAGGRSQAAGVLAVAIVLAVAWIAGDALASVPHAALSGVLIYVAVRLVRVRAMRTDPGAKPGRGDPGRRRRRAGHPVSDRHRRRARDRPVGAACPLLDRPSAAGRARPRPRHHRLVDGRARRRRRSMCRACWSSPSGRRSTS